ncbi:MAG: hypothetical protein ACLR9K_00350 [Blautia sp.]
MWWRKPSRYEQVSVGTSRHVKSIWRQGKATGGIGGLACAREGTWDFGQHKERSVLSEKIWGKYAGIGCFLLGI